MTRLETLSRTRYDREAEIEKLRERLEELPGEIQAARQKAIRQSPTQSTFVRASPVAKLNAEVERLKARIPNLEGELLALDVLIQHAAKEQGLVDLLGPIEQAEALGQQELEAWDAIGGIVQTYVERLNEILAIATARDQLLLANEEAVSHCPDEQLKARALAAFSQKLAPFPSDTKALAVAALDACLDSDGADYREEFGQRIDYANFLTGVMPDLRSQFVRAVLSGRNEVSWSRRNVTAPLAVLPAL